MPDPTSSGAVHDQVRAAYADVATRAGSCCAGQRPDTRTISEGMGYAAESLDAVPAAANLGVGCGNPTALALLEPGDVVVDLGSGGGLDAFVASRAVGPEGHVIGVDMTREMLASARKSAVDMGVHDHVEFRQGLIEAAPVASGLADVVVSNCVINLSPDKPAVFREAFRILKPGGKLAVSDIVLSAPMPDEVRDLPGLLAACIGGASTEAEYLAAIRGAGFVDVEWSRTPAASLISLGSDPMVGRAMESLGAERVAALADTVWSYAITARKP